jgi:hypothetical protein
MSVIKVNSVNNITKVTSKNEIVKINNVNNVNTIINASAGYLSIDFVSGDTTLEIGVVPVNKAVVKTVVKVTTAGSGTVTIGTDASQGILQSASQNDLSTVLEYEVNNNLLLNTNTTYKAFFTSNTAIGQIIIYYS